MNHEPLEDTVEDQDVLAEETAPHRDYILDAWAWLLHHEAGVTIAQDLLRRCHFALPVIDGRDQALHNLALELVQLMASAHARAAMAAVAGVLLDRCPSSSPH